MERDALTQALKRWGKWNREHTTRRLNQTAIIAQSHGVVVDGGGYRGLKDDPVAEEVERGALVMRKSSKELFQALRLYYIDAMTTRSGARKTAVSQATFATRLVAAESFMWAWLMLRMVESGKTITVQNTPLETRQNPG
ncbi:MAG: hypothetical protein HQL50_11870 [Magnetococcales bacterium]|nr:hypothetical protein [Magnetococcales bacterium]